MSVSVYLQLRKGDRFGLGPGGILFAQTRTGETYKSATSGVSEYARFLVNPIAELPKGLKLRNFRPMEFEGEVWTDGHVSSAEFYMQLGEGDRYVRDALGFLFVATRDGKAYRSDKTDVSEDALFLAGRIPEVPEDLAAKLKHYKPLTFEQAESEVGCV